MSPVGLEPTALRLKGGCSSVELRALDRTSGTDGTRTRSLPGDNRALSPLELRLRT